MSRDGLEAGIQQRGVHPVGALLRADGPGSPTSASTVPTVPSAVCAAARPANAGPY